MVKMYCTNLETNKIEETQEYKKGNWMQGCLLY